MATAGEAHSTISSGSSPETKRAVPMRVLCLGQSRTGTSSAKAALERLGFNKTYHYMELFWGPEADAHAHFWRRAMDFKHHGKGTLTRSDWDQLLGDYAAVTDNPCCYFAEDLIAAYPEAKVVLQTRELHAWAASWIDTIKYTLCDPVMRYLYTFDRDSSRWFPLTMDIQETYMGKGFPKENLVAEHKRFLKQVRGLVPKENLLEWRVQDGWKPLCEFLEVEVPNEPFPKLFEKEIFLGIICDVRKKLMYRAAWWYGARAATIAAIGAAIWWAYTTLLSRLSSHLHIHAVTDEL